MLKKWEDLPDYMRTKEVRPYYDNLKKKQVSLFSKRCFDLIVGIIVFIILSPIMVIFSIAIAIDSKGGVFFRQERVTQYGRKFRIFKFRTMVANAESIGSQVTVQNDTRITRVGKLLRKTRLDEFPQLINVILGDMSFVGTRPEVGKYVDYYTPEMYATLLLPAGITSIASIQYKDEDELLANADNVDDIYVNSVLPNKMKYNLFSIKNFSFFGELITMIKTVYAVLK